LIGVGVGLKDVVIIGVGDSVEVGFGVGVIDNANVLNTSVAGLDAPS
jgi:hypothetical protein